MPLPDVFDILAYIPLLLLAQPSIIPLHHIAAALHVPTLGLTLGHQSPLSPSSLNNGEFPACANMGSGYIFRVENEATVFYLQSIGTTGALTHLKAKDLHDCRGTISGWEVPFLRSVVHCGFLLLAHRLLALLEEFLPDPWNAVLTTVMTIVLVAYLTTQSQKGYSLINTILNHVTTFVAFYLLIPFPTSNILICLALITLSSLITAQITALLSRPGWYGASEPGVRGSLLILLSRDRWIRLDGLTDDLKAVTSGSWMSPPSSFQHMVLQTASLLHTIGVLIALTAVPYERFALVAMVIARHFFISWACCSHNLQTMGMAMKGKMISIDTSKGADGDESGVVKYKRRLVMAEELIEEFGGNRDWAVGMGMVKPDKEKREEYKGEVIM